MASAGATPDGPLAKQPSLERLPEEGPPAAAAGSAGGEGVVTPGSPPRLAPAAGGSGSATLPPGSATLPPAPQVPSSRVDRLLLQRLRKSQSATTLYGESPMADAEVAAEPSVYTAVAAASSQRLLVIANRLPVSAVKDKAGKWQLQVAAGGLVSALMGVSNFKTCWIGWPGVYVEEGPDRDALTAALGLEGYIPVYLDPKTVDLHYNGFCNSVLWQLFHYVPLNMDSKLSETRTLQFQWIAHQEANRRFAEVVFKHYQDGDVVWCQDYHLMLLPALLKLRKPKMKVGWFLHTPFPSSEIYRTLPVREEVLRAVLKADLIGFHTYDYARHFVSACTRILGLEGTPEGVEDNGTLTRVAAFPIGIDPERFARALERADVRSNTAQLLNRYAGRKVMLGVDRLDMIKGIPQKLLAFEKFLEEHPEWRDKVLLVQIAVPSRTDVPEYQSLRSMVHEIVGRINGQYGTLTHVPIHHLDRQLSFHELCALYAITDVALVTSLRDGMNLVSYEYVACQSDNAGVLILSEFAGAAQSLGAGAILVNPWNITDMAAAIEDALTMSDQERRERHRQNYMHITIHTSQTWADTFISELNDTHVEAELRTKHIPPQLDIEEVVRTYKGCRRRLLVLGYNATLTTAVEAPRQPKRHFDQIRALTRVNPTVYNSVAALCSAPDTSVVIFSGSDKAKLEETFGDLHVWLAAENGIFMRPPPDNGVPQDWVMVGEAVKKEWMESVQLVFDYFCERTPRSFVEARETSVVWNYKYADVEFGRLQARDLLQHLWTGPISNAPVDIVQGSKSVEVRPVGISKGLAVQRILAAVAQRHGLYSVDYDFVLVCGHFLARDENIFTYFEGHSVRLSEHTRHHAAAPPGHDPHHHRHQAHDRHAAHANSVLSTLTEALTEASSEEAASTAASSSRDGGPTTPSSPAPAGGGPSGAATPSSSRSPSVTAAAAKAVEAFAATGASAERWARGRRDGASVSGRPTTPPSQGLAAGFRSVSARGAGERPFLDRLSLDSRVAAGAGATSSSNGTARGSGGGMSSSHGGAHGGASRMGSGGAGPSAPMPIKQPPAVRAFHAQHHGHQRNASGGTPDGHGMGTSGGFGGASFSSAAPEPAPLPLRLPPPHLYTCTVGRSRSQARYFLHGSSEVAQLLGELSGRWPPSSAAGSLGDAMSAGSATGGEGDFTDGSFGTEGGDLAGALAGRHLSGSSRRGSFSP